MDNHKGTKGTKRKNGEGRVFWGGYAFVTFIFVVLSVMAVLFYTVRTESVCVAFEDVDFVIYGFEGDADYRSGSLRLIDALDRLGLDSVASVPEGAVQYVDFIQYSQWEMVAMLSFWHDADMRVWYVVVRDGDERDCGVYRVDGERRVFDVLKTDE